MTPQQNKTEKVYFFGTRQPRDVRVFARFHCYPPRKPLKQGGNSFYPVFAQATRQNARRVREVPTIPPRTPKCRLPEKIRRFGRRVQSNARLAR